MVNRLFRWGIFIALVVLAACSFIAIRIVFGDNNNATVPSLIGMSAIEATNQLQLVGLAARIDKVDSEYPENTVVSQSIASGEQTDRGKIVIIKVSRGGTQVKIPDVRNKEFPMATQELEAAGLKVGAVIRVSDQLKQPNMVIAQNPAAPALVMNNRMVDLLVSEGGTGRAETVQVPDLRGETEEHARQILEQSYLEVSKVLTKATSQFPEGTVVNTEPRAGTRVPTGRAIVLHIAKTPEPAAVQEPRPQVNTQPQAPPLDIPPTEAPARGGQAAEIPPWNPNQPTQVQTSPSSGNQPAVQPVQPQPQPVIPAPIPVPPTGSKVAKVRYQVPPLARPLNLNIVMNDQSGTRVLRQQQVQGGEYVSMDTPYSGSAIVTVSLGEQQVWQERYN
ncbi:MAG: PASTA domain-containing protein [Synergistaceae bacterium]|jgi:serine/threonine-protein kinase|nr:PASTA domain-containing protein [Synergistaceae bacterium]